MNRTKVVGVCEKCKYPNKLEVNLFGQVKIVGVVCKCELTGENNINSNKKSNYRSVNRCYGEK